MANPHIRESRNNPDKLEVQGENGYREVTPTMTQNGYKLVIAQGTGLENFGLKDEDFKKRDGFGTHSGSATGVIVINEDNQVVGKAVGRMDGSRDKFTMTGVKLNDGTLIELENRGTVPLEGNSGERKIVSGKNAPDNAEGLAGLVARAAEEHARNLAARVGIGEALVSARNSQEVQAKTNRGGEIGR